VPADGIGDGQHVPKVSGPISVRRSSDGNEDDFSAGNRAIDVSRERQAVLSLIAFDKILEARLVNGNLTLSQHSDLAGVKVRTNHIISRLCETGAHNKADIPSSDD
jgi:hypothetical protein